MDLFALFREQLQFTHIQKAFAVWIGEGGSTLTLGVNMHAFAQNCMQPFPIR